MEGAGGDEEDVVGLYRAVLGGHHCALDQRQQVTLHALAGHIPASAAIAGADLVDLVEEDDAGILHEADGLAHDLLFVQQLVGFLGDEDVVRFLHRHAARLGLATKGLAQHVRQVHHANAGTGHAGQLEAGHLRLGADLDLDFLVIKVTLAQLLAEAVTGGRAGAAANEGIEHPLFRQHMGLGLHFLAAQLAHQRDAGLHKVADDLFHITADIADLGELGGFHLDERRIGETCQAAGNLGLADARGSDHENVLRQNLLAHRAFQLLAAPAVAQGNGHGALGILLPDDIAVELGDDFPG